MYSIEAPTSAQSEDDKSNIVGKNHQITSQIGNKRQKHPSLRWDRRKPIVRLRRGRLAPKARYLIADQIFGKNCVIAGYFVELAKSAS
jgi:hypothetical protein